MIYVICPRCSQYSRFLCDSCIPIDICDSDAAEGGDANAAPGPKAQQARAESIAQTKPNNTRDYP